MSAAEKLIFTEEQYLEAERLAETKSEFVNGEVFSIAGGTGNHALISENCIRALGNGLTGRPCRVYGSDLKIRTDEGNHYYPDLSALCGTAELFDEQEVALVNPNLIVEVLSPSTEAYDRGFKFSAYRTIPSLRDYILISQDSANIDHFHKNDEGQWLLASDGETQSLRLPHLDIEIPYKEIYANVDFQK